MTDEAHLVALRELWRKGAAWRYLLDAAGPTGGQQAWRAHLLAAPPLASTVWNIGRQRGKTYAAVFVCIEKCVTTPDAIVRYCAKTKDSARAIVTPAWEYVVSTLPEAWRPEAVSDYEWHFPSTGARFVLFGTDAQSFARGRGPRTHLQCFDEAGFYQDLPAVEAALLPSLQTTDGHALYLSTPAESLGHPFTERVRAAQAAGRYQHDTFWSNPRVNHEAVIAAECARLGLTREQLLATTYFRREYLAELVAEESRAAVPAWTQEAEAAIVREVPRPPNFDAYLGVDWGFSPDPCAALAGWFDFPSQTLVVEEEVELHRGTISAFCGGLKQLERRLWGVERYDGTLAAAVDWGDLPEYLARKAHGSAPRQPFMRVGDPTQPLVLSELASVHGYAVLPSRNDDKHLAVDALNERVVRRRLAIHPRCVRLRAQLYSTVWNKARTEWERTDRDHGDLLDCLVLLDRNVRLHRDPRPRPLSVVPSVPQGNGGWDAIMRRR